VGDAGKGARAADARDRGEMGDPVSVAGCGRKPEREARRRWGADGRAQVAQCRAVRFEPDLKQIPNSNVSNKSQTASKFGRLEKYFP
jgi:hypothetical protein